MKKLISVIVVSLALGIGSGLLVFWLVHLNVTESFEPFNPVADTDEIRPSQ